MARSLVASDDFNRADSTNLGANWTEYGHGTPDVSINSNGVIPSASNNDDNAAMYSGGSAPANNQYASLLITTLPTGASEIGVTCRTNGSTGSRTQYGATASGDGTYRALFKHVSDTYTELATGSATLSAGGVDRIEIEAEGTTIRWCKNGVSQFTTTDASVTSGRGGINFWRTTGKGDDFEFGDIVAAVVSLPILVMAPPIPA